MEKKRNQQEWKLGKKKLGKNGCWEKRKLGKLKFVKLGKGKSRTVKGNRKNKEIWVIQKKGIILEILTFEKMF